MTERVVVIGASGFGRESLDVLDAMRLAGSDIEILGVVDDDASPINRARLAARGVSFLGTRSQWLSSRDLDASYVLGIGNPKIRRAIVGLLEVAGLTAFTAIHPSITRGASTLVGEGSVICAGVTLSNNVQIGRHVHVNPNAAIGHDTILSDFVSVNPGAVISGDVEVREGALLGAGAIILQGISVGQGVVVGAGAVVTKNVTGWQTVIGVPAHPVATVSQEESMKHQSPCEFPHGPGAVI